VPAQHIVSEFLATSRNSRRAEDGSFSLKRMLEKLAEGAAGGSR